MAGTSDIEDEYDSKSEMDFNRRLIVKFKIPNNGRFWGNDFKVIPESALYPKNDAFYDICKEIELDVKRELKPGEIGEFLSDWSELEELIIMMSDVPREHSSFFNALKLIRKRSVFEPSLINNIDKLRRFRNELVHSPKKIESGSVEKFSELLSYVKEQLRNES